MVEGQYRLTDRGAVGDCLDRGNVFGRSTNLFYKRQILTYQVDRHAHKALDRGQGSHDLPDLATVCRPDHQPLQAATPGWRKARIAAL